MLNPTVKRRIKKVLLGIEILLILVLGAGMGIVLGAFYQMNKLLPPDSVLDSYQPPVGTKIISSDGEILAKLAAENREPVPLAKIPKHMQQAMVAIEDSRFFSHSGLDYRGLARALWANISGHEMAQGGSTITQQLARNMFLSSRKTISRKIKEILLAVQIERNWTKNQILEAYLNQVYFGAGAYGIKAASVTYFGKGVEKLTLPEEALLAGLPQRPSDLSPFAAYKLDGSYKRSKMRRDMVLDRMAELGFITPEQARKAKDAPIKVIKERARSTGYFKAKYFSQYVVEQLRDQMGYTEDVLDKAGLTVVTTLNWKMQEVAEHAAKEARERLRRARVTEAALICIDPHTGYIRAMVGGVNEPWEKYQFNCATQAKRQPGSAFKLFVYTAAMEEGGSPYSSVRAAAIPIRMVDGTYYAPKSHGDYDGYISYLNAFAQSVNGAAVNVCAKIKPEKVKAMAERMGIKSELRPYYSLALGTSEVSPLEMASAYGVLPAKGKHAEPLAILQVKSLDGEILEDMQPRVTDTGLKQRTIGYMDQLTRAVVTSGTARVASGVPNAHGKTGTSEEFTDAWFVGYTPDLVTAVWCGNRNNSRMANGLFGGRIAAPIWAEFMKQAIELNPAKKKKPSAPTKVARTTDHPRTRRERNPRTLPAEITADGNERNRVRLTICTESGLLASSRCPSTETREFMLGEMPRRRCTLQHSGKHSRKSAAAKQQPGDGEKKEGAGEKKDGDSPEHGTGAEEKDKDKAADEKPAGKSAGD
jgi:penicillin-binding protein 1A